MASDAEDIYNDFYNDDALADEYDTSQGLVLRDEFVDEDGYNTEFSDMDEGDDNCKEYNDTQDVDSEGHLSCDEIKSPTSGKTVFWVPKVKEGVAPAKGQLFETWKDAVDAYYAYGFKAGFDCRIGGTKYVKKEKMYRYIICSCAGETKKQEGSVVRKRKRKSKRSNCEAQVCLKMVGKPEKYVVHKIFKTHNHELFTDETIHTSKHVRKLDFQDQSLIYSLNNLNYGATKAHNIVTHMEGGYDSIGPKCSDFKNFAHALNAAIEDTDANTVVSILKARKEMFPSFSFEYELEGTELRALFWADDIAKRNYEEFNDLVSFDGTYRTNKYGLIFVPFTGIDNHKRCVTFGGALIAKETIESYTWLLQKFKEAFPTPPKVVVTDQDASICSAVAKVLPNSIHRICMWHVVRKLPKYVKSNILHETDFRKKFCRLVWSECVDTMLFEHEWNNIIKEFKQEDNDWLKRMFSLRQKWIPGYFRDTPLSALMRTTARSESENFFFQSFLSVNSNLLSFLCKFDLAMDRQRKNQKENDSDDIHKKPMKETHSTLEEQAAGFYTFKKFGIVQNEILDSVWSCSPGDSYMDRNMNETCLVAEKDMGKSLLNRSEYFQKKKKDYYNKQSGVFKYEVKIKDNNETFSCSCLLFEQYGILCRHVFCVMKKKFVNEIPEKYLLRRWQKSIIRPDELIKKYSLMERGGGCAKKVKELYKVMNDCVGLIAHDDEALTEYLNWMKEKRREIKENPPQKDKRTHKEMFEVLSGISLTGSKDKEISNPENITTKGRPRSNKRLQGKQEIAMNAAKKNHKFCTYCRKNILPEEKHDRRNCPLKRQHEEAQEKQNEAEMENAGVFKKKKKKTGARHS